MDRHPSKESLPRRTLVWLASGAVLVIAFVLRVFPTVSESQHWDAVSYVRASREGLLANWIDQGYPGIESFGRIWDFKIPYNRTAIKQGADVLKLRHYHPPMLAYLLWLQEKLVGFSDFKVRLYSMLSGALNCALLVIAVVVLRGGTPLGLASGVAAGVVLASTPYHLFVSRTASYHALFPLVVSAFLFALGRAVDTARHTWLALSLCLLATALGTFEWAILLPVPLVVGLLWSRNPWLSFSARGGLRVSSTALLMSLGAFLLFALLWPAGVIKADLAETLLHNALYGKEHAYGRPWWAFFTMYYHSGPAIAIVQALGLAYLAVRVITRRATGGTVVWLIFGVAFVIASVPQKLVSPHYIAPLFPVGALAGGVLVHDLGALLRRYAAYLPICALLASSGLTAVQKWDHPRTDPREVPGFSQAAVFLRDAADRADPILSTAAPLLRFYLPSHEIRRIPYKPMPGPLLGQIKRHRFRFVVVYKDQLEHIRRFREGGAYRYIVANLRLAKTIRHLRRGYPCLWIYEDPLYGGKVPQHNHSDAGQPRSGRQVGLRRC